MFASEDERCPLTGKKCFFRLMIDRIQRDLFFFFLFDVIRPGQEQEANELNGCLGGKTGLGGSGSIGYGVLVIIHWYRDRTTR